MRVAIVLSVAVHVGVVVWAASDPELPGSIVAQVRPPVHRVEPPAASAPSVAEPPDPLLEIQLLPDAAIAKLPRWRDAPARSLPRPASAARSISSGADHAVTIETPRQDAPAPVPPTRTSLTMRRPDLRVLPSELVTEFLARTPPRSEVPDLPGARIDAEISELRDRMKHARDGADLTADRERLVGLREQRAHVELKQHKDGTYSATRRTFEAEVERDGTVHLHDRSNAQLEGGAVTFDVTDALMRAHGIDPYASAKLRMLDRTRDQRVAIGREFRRMQLSHSAELMQANVERAWTITTDVHARKQDLFELWDECAEAGDPEVVAGGAAARQYVTRFIQVKLRGADAYTADELARLNARRRSQAVFAPYE
jgi:hypothetical protein